MRAPGLLPQVSAPPNAPHETAQQLLRLNYTASGGDHWNKLRQADMTGSVDLGGLQGTFHQTVDLKSGRDATTLDAGPVHLKQVSLQDSSWQLDQSRIVTYADTPDAKQDAITQSFIDRNGWFTPGPYDATYLGVRQERGQIYQLVSILPPGGRQLTLWLGMKDHLLYRIEQVDAFHERSTLFLSDYRSADGVLIPYSVRQSNGSADQDIVQTVNTVNLSSHLDEKIFTPPPSDFRDAALLSDKDSAVVPFELADGRICVQVSIEGHKPLPFLVDSGAGNYLTPEAAHAFAIKGTGNIPLSGAGEGQENAHIAQVSSVHLGPVELRNQQFIVGPLPKFLQDRGGKPPIAGLLGAELLRRFPTTFDYQHQTLTFYRPGTAFHPLPNSTAVPLLFNGGHAFIQLQVDGSPGVFGIDTGDSSGIMLFRPFYDEHHFPVEQPAQSKEQGGIGGRTTAWLTRISSVRLGNATLDQPLVTLNSAAHGAFSAQGIAGNLGHGFLKNFVFTLDYERRTAYVQPSADLEKPAEYNRSGLGLSRAQDGALVVTYVNAGTPAARAGIKVGDKIIRMNGEDPASTAGEVFSHMLSAPAGSQVSLVISRDGRDRNLSLTLEELLPLNGIMKPLDLSPHS